MAVFTAAHPYLSGIGIWIVASVIAAGIWAMCKERDDEELYERRGGDGDPQRSVRSVASVLSPVGKPRVGTPSTAKRAQSLRDSGDEARDSFRAGSEPADAHTNYYTPPSFSKPAVKGFRRVS